MYPPSGNLSLSHKAIEEAARTTIALLRNVAIGMPSIFIDNNITDQIEF
jgi:hypothetical protein